MKTVYTNQKDPERLFNGMKVEGGQREQQPRTKLMMLANELDAGTIKHRLQGHTQTLDHLRAEAVAELQNEAVQPGPVKKLPGPNADEWFHWACGLQDGHDHSTLAELRANFPALECFIRRMEESYWIAGKRADVAAIPFAWIEKYETRESGDMQESSLYPAGSSLTAATPARLFPIFEVENTSELPGSQRWRFDSDESKVQLASPCSTEQVPVGDPGEMSDAPAAADNLAYPRHCDMQDRSHDPVLEKLRIIVAQHESDHGSRLPGSLVQRYTQSDDPKVVSEGSCTTEQVAVGQPEKGDPPAAPDDLAHPRHDNPQGHSGDADLERLRTIVAQHDADQGNRTLGSLVQRYMKCDEPKSESESPCSTTQVPVGKPEKGDALAAGDNLADPRHDNPKGHSGDADLERLRAMFAQHDGDQGNRTVRSLLQRYKPVLPFGAIAAILVLSVAFLHPAGVGVSKLRTVLLAARTQALGTVQDSEIQKEVDLKLAALNNSSLRATVESGAVTLAGHTSSQWESLYAESLSARINGVKAVRNEIQVEVFPAPNQHPAKRVRRKSAK